MAYPADMRTPLPSDALWALDTTPPLVLPGVHARRPTDGALFLVYLEPDSGEPLLVFGTPEHPHAELTEADLAAIRRAYLKHKESLS